MAVLCLSEWVIVSDYNCLVMIFTVGVIFMGCTTLIKITPAVKIITNVKIVENHYINHVHHICNAKTRNAHHNRPNRLKLIQ